MLIPTALGKLHPAAAQAYKAGKLAWRFTGASTLGVLDGFLGYALTLNGKAKIFWSLWAIKVGKAGHGAGDNRRRSSTRQSCS